MTSDVKKPVNQVNTGVVEQSPVEPKQEIPEPIAAAPLDPAILAAIQAAVASAIPALVAHLTQTNSSAQPERPTLTTPKAPGYVSKLKGIEVQAGQDLRDVPHGTITSWFMGVENRWKEAYNKKSVGGTPVNMNWTRG